MRIVLLDPGFEDNNSHHASVNAALAQATEHKQYSLTILASRKYDQNLSTDSTKAIIPWFNTPCYINQLKALEANKELQIAQQFCDELKKASEQGHIAYNDTIILHSGFSFHILGIAKWLKHLDGGFKGKTIICGMFYPGKQRIQSKAELNDYLWFLRYKMAFALLKQATLNTNTPNPSVQIASSCQEYIDAFTNCAKLPIELHPAVNFTAPKTQKPPHNIKKKVILYLGNLKFDKGIEALTQQLPSLLSTFSDIEFFVQFNQSSPSAINFKKQQDAILKLNSIYTNLELHLQALSADEYEYRLATSDAIVLFYEYEAYKNKTSGLLWDVTRHKHLSLFCTEGIWAQREYSSMGGIPIVFSDKSSLISQLQNWQEQGKQILALNEYGQKINLSFADWCLQIAQAQ